MASRNLTEIWILSQTTGNSADDRWAGFLVSVECLIGFGMLCAVITGCRKLKNLQTPFGMLMLNQNISQLLACVDSGSFFFFGVLLNLDFVMDRNGVFGLISIFLLPIILGSFFLMSLNRLCATTFIFAYDKIFKKRNIIIFVVGNWIFSLASCSYVFLSRKCSFVFYRHGWFFTGALYNDTCRDFIVSYNFLIQISLTASIFFFDIVTLVVLVFLRNRIYNKQNAVIRRRELRFAGQVLIQGVVFLAHGFWYDKGYSLLPGNDERWKYFFTSSFSSNLLHVFDPLVVFLFNPEFRTWMSKFFTKHHKVNVTAAVSTAASRS